MKVSQKRVTSFLLLMAMVITLAITPGFSNEVQTTGQEVTGKSVQQEVYSSDGQTVSVTPIPTEITPQVIEKKYNGTESDRFIIKWKSQSAGENAKDKIKSKIKESKQVSSKKFSKKLDVIKTKSKMTKEELLSELKSQGADSNVEYIEPDIEISLATNDTYFSSQWGIQNVSDSVYGSSIDAGVVSAWSQSQGEGVTVAVIDSGVDVNHVDLKNNLWKNTDEIAGNGVDDDADGYVDNIYGYNFCGDNGDISDIYGHGTAVAGIIAAEGNNNKGIVGVAPKANIMALKAFNNGTGYVSDIVEALGFAEVMGAKIASCSFASTVDSLALKEAIKKSYLLVVCSAGNNGTNNDNSPMYPASYDLPNVISVTAVDRNGNLPSFANYGATSVQVAAPGKDIVSTLPGNTYGEKSGTSVATPFVAGEAALILSQYNGLRAAEIKDKIMSSCDQLPSLSGKVVNGNMINCAKAVSGQENTQVVEQEVNQEPNTVSTVVYDVYAQMNLQTVSSNNNGGMYSVVSVPSGGVDGQLDVTVKGRTVVNLLGNDGDCDNTNTFLDWYTAHQVDYNNSVFGQSSIRATILPNSVGATIVACDEIRNKLDSQKYYLISGYLKNGNASTGVQMQFFTNGQGATFLNSPIVNDNTRFTRVGLRLKPSDWGTNYNAISLNALTIIGLTDQYGYLDGFMINEITPEEYNQDTNELLQKYPYVNSVIRTNNIRIKSVGKNLLNEDNLLTQCSNLTITENDNGSYCFKQTSTMGAVSRSTQVDVKPNTFYKLTFSNLVVRSGINVVACIYQVYNDGTLSPTFYRHSKGDMSFFKTSDNTVKLKILLASDGTNSITDCDFNLQLEEGTEASQYYPYKESIEYVNQELISLSNGSVDQINISHNEKITNNHCITLNNSQDWYLNSYSSQVNGFKIVNMTALVPTSNILCIKTDGSILKYFDTQDWQENTLLYWSYENAWQISIPNSDSGWAQNYSPSSQDIKNYFNAHPYTLIYQLAQPQTNKISLPPLTTYQNGTIIIDRAIKQVGIYKGGLGISDKDFPIQAIESIYKLDGNTKIPVTSYTVAPNGLSLTINGANDGEAYEFVYTYDSSLSVLPEIEYTVPTTTGDQIEGSIDMIKQQSDVINNLMSRLEKLEKQVEEPRRLNVGPFQVNCTANTNFNLVVTASNSKDFSSRTFKVIYNTTELDVVDLCAATSTLETGVCNVAGTNIVITNVQPGVIEFMINNPVQNGTNFSGAVNNIVFWAKTGLATISYTAQ